MVYVCVEIGYILEAGGDSPAIFGEHGSGIELMFGCAEYRIVHVQIAVIGFDRPMGVNTVSSFHFDSGVVYFPGVHVQGCRSRTRHGDDQIFPVDIKNIDTIRQSSVE